jgi:hypothetical protein
MDIEPQAQALSEVVLKNKETHAAYMQIVRESVWIIGGVGGLALLFTFLLIMFGKVAPDVMLMITVSSVSMIAGFFVGRATTDTPQ